VTAHLSLVNQNPNLSQRQLAAKTDVSLGKANYGQRALVEKGLVKLGNFGKNPNKRQCAYIVTPAGLGVETQITLAFLEREDAEFNALWQTSKPYAANWALPGRFLNGMHKCKTIAHFD